MIERATETCFIVILASIVKKENIEGQSLNTVCCV